MHEAFIFKIRGTADGEQLTLALADDLSYVEQRSTFELLYSVNQQANWLFYVYFGINDHHEVLVFGLGSLLFRPTSTYLPTAQSVAQDVFCTLERRGFLLEFVGGDIGWE